MSCEPVETEEELVKEPESKFWDACVNGNLVRARELYKSGNVDIHADNDAFQWICGMGLLEVAKWLYSKGINIHKEDEYAFRLACWEGHLEVAKWLYSLPDKVDIHADDDDAFHGALLESHFEIVNWFYSIGYCNCKYKKMPCRNHLKNLYYTCRIKFCR